MRIIAKLNTKSIIPKATFFNTDRGLAWKRRRLYARLSFTFFILNVAERCFDCIFPPNWSLRKDFPREQTTRVSAE